MDSQCISVFTVCTLCVCIVYGQPVYICIYCMYINCVCVLCMDSQCISVFTVCTLIVCVYCVWTASVYLYLLYVH